MKQMPAAQLKEWLDQAKAGGRCRPCCSTCASRGSSMSCAFAGAKLMPMRSIPARYPELQRDAETVVICHHGARSYQVAMFLEQQGFSNVINLYGGMAAWSRDVDPTAPTY